MTNSERIGCTVTDCVCYPFVHFKCEYCQKVFVLFITEGDRGQSGCVPSVWRKELELTDCILTLAINLEIIVLDLQERFRIFQNGVRGNLRFQAENFGCGVPEIQQGTVQFRCTQSVMVGRL